MKSSALSRGNIPLNGRMQYYICYLLADWVWLCGRPDPGWQGQVLPCDGRLSSGHLTPDHTQAKYTNRKKNLRTKNLKTVQYIYKRTILISVLVSTNYKAANLLYCKIELWSWENTFKHFLGTWFGLFNVNNLVLLDTSEEFFKLLELFITLWYLHAVYSCLMVFFLLSIAV